MTIENEEIGLLDNALTKAVDICTREKIGILFSGGLDSALLAVICEDLKRDATLYSVGMKGSHDPEHIEESRRFSRSELEVREIYPRELEKYAAKVVCVIKNSHPMHVSIGIPMYVACEMAKKEVEVILSGQGADELFAGYHRYLRMTPKELERALLRDLEKLRRVDLHRDEAIARANSLELRAPYLDENVVDLAMGMPVDLKIKNGVRKYALRKIAEKRGLPEFIVNREKKAIQYSTGVDRALRKLAKEEDTSLEEYLQVSMAQLSMEA